MTHFLRYPKTLSSGIHNTVLALSEKEVAKLFDGDIGSEVEKMRFANQTNGLVGKFILLDFDKKSRNAGNGKIISGRFPCIYSRKAGIVAGSI